MLDTIGIRCGAPLRDASLFRQGSRIIPFGKGWKGRIRDGVLVRVEGSLTCYNAGRLADTETEFSTSLATVFVDIAELADAKEWQFDRLDIARDVPEPTVPLVRACRQHRIPGIHKAAEVADDDTSIRWGNGRTMFQVQLYDAAKRHRIPAPSSRLEIRLRFKKIAKLGLQRETSWARLEEVFTGFTMGLPDVAVCEPQGRLESGQIIALMDPLIGPENTRKLFQLMTQERSRPTTRKIRRQMNEGLSRLCPTSPRQAFTLPSYRIVKILSTPATP